MLLSLHTCGNVATLALGEADPSGSDIKIVATAQLAPRTYAARLVPEIAAMLAAHHLRVRDLSAIVVVNGPGSFTGVRVGVSTAKGLAEGGEVPLIAVSRLALLAHASGLAHVLAAVDAGRAEHYMGEYRAGERLWERLLSDAEAIAVARLPGAGVLVCDESSDRDSVAPNTSGCATLAVSDPLYVQPPDAADALRFGVSRWRTRQFDDPMKLEANYLRRSDAEVVLAARTGVSAPE